MAVYKVIQDIEAEDKLLGPLTLKQFIYAIIFVAFGFAGFMMGRINPILALPAIPPMIIFGFLAAPLGREQPNEIWLAARVRFFLKPQKRIWDQTGMKELVTITAPKQVQQIFSSNMSQNEVRSRLHALADTLDSRGWAVKNANVNMYAHPSYAAITARTSDRLVAASSIPSQPVVHGVDVRASDDIMDAQNNPVAQNFDRMMQAAAQEHRQEVVTKMQQAASPAPQKAAPPQPTPDYWFMYQGDAGSAAPPGYGTFGSQVVAPGSQPPQTNAPLLQTKDDEYDGAALLAQLNKEDESKSHLKKILPLDEQEKLKKKQQAEAKTGAATAPQNQAEAATKPAGNQTMTAPPPPAILELANNDELSVATLAQQAKRVQEQDLADDEVVISLH